MDPLSNLDSQQFSERTLKGFLLKNVTPNDKNPTLQQLNDFLIKRVDIFWDTVVVPLKNKNNFDGNKINWYFEVYKEGLDAHKLSTNQFTFLVISDDIIREIVSFYDGKILNQYLDLGTSFLSNSYSLLTSWMRDKMIKFRLEKIYYSNDPHEWILMAEKEEHGVMKQQCPETVVGVPNILNNIGLIMSKRV